MTGSDFDPFLLLSQDDSDWGEEIDRADLFCQAAQRFDPSQPEPLAALLTADEPWVRRRGLVVFGDLGRKARGLLDLALQSAQDPDEAARAALMDGVICYSESLSVPQTRIVLELAGDPSDLVRSRVVCFIRESSLDVLRAAIAGMPSEAASDYSKGLERLAALNLSAQALLEEGASTTGVSSTFALAAVERMAKDGLIEGEPPTVSGSWIGECTQAQIVLLIARRARLAGQVLSRHS